MISQRDDELPDELVLAIQRVLELQNTQNDDPLDTLSSKFDLTGLLNHYFPKEESLGQIQAVQARLAQDEIELRREIEALRAELKRDQDPARMQLIQETISELLGQMSRIREKATESEAVVKDITKDIQSLDLAKKNLILSMTTLKRLQMLVNALSQLEDLLKSKKYSEISQSLAAVKQLSASFKPYLSIQRISQIWKRIQEVQGQLQSQLDGDFDAFFLQDSSKPIKPAVISDACLVVDVLGVEMRTQLLDRYGSLELKDYRRIFRATDEAGQLDNISRRFAWFRRLLLTHETEQGRVFPSEWKVGWYLLARFIEITRDDMTALLSKAGSSLTVKQLLDPLVVVVEFETSMVKKFATPLQDILNTVAATSSRSFKSISSAFEPHMGVFVEAQDKALADMLAVHRGIKTTRMQSRPSLDVSTTSSEPDNGSGASPILVLPSSTELFYLYAQNLEQCAKLSTGKALFDLCAVHKKWLRVYAEDVLTASLKRPSTQVRRSADSRVDIHQLKQACTLINTADYCQVTALELEQKIREKIDEPYKDRVSLQAECDLFVGVISTAIMVQLRELDFACEPAFSAMSRTTWSNLKQVSGQSVYAGDVVSSVEQVIALVKPLVEQKKYLRNLFDKTCSLIITKFTNALVKSRPLKEIGAEQLLIDLQAIKAYLTKLPGESLTTPAYSRGLAKNTSRLEALLKVIVTPLDPYEGFILNYTILIGDAEFPNFQKVLDLKGTSKAEQNSVLDSFLTITSTKPDLETTSFLSSLDMDPPSLSINSGNLASPALGSPTRTGSSTPSNLPDNQSSNRPGESKREVFQDFRRLMSLGLRRDTTQGS